MPGTQRDEDPHVSGKPELLSMPLGPTKSQQTRNRNISAKNETGWQQEAVKGEMLTHRVTAIRVKDGMSLCHTRCSDYGGQASRPSRHTLMSQGTIHNLDLC